MPLCPKYDQVIMYCVGLFWGLPEVLHQYQYHVRLRVICFMYKDIYKCLWHTKYHINQKKKGKTYAMRNCHGSSVKGKTKRYNLIFINNSIEYSNILIFSIMSSWHRDIHLYSEHKKKTEIFWWQSLGQKKIVTDRFSELLRNVDQHSKLQP